MNATDRLEAKSIERAYSRGGFPMLIRFKKKGVWMYQDGMTYWKNKRRSFERRMKAKGISISLRKTP